ncbi:MULTISPECIES: excisionase family DNA-binding protein [unclassified Methylophilus]|uniref:helix-turn-helix transcriptional regulator n=1 Tax=unclassified Methylophilus TaxID=2630143 RepID=UPI00036DE2A5
MRIKTDLVSNPSILGFDRLSDDAYIRPKECAKLLGVSEGTFWRLVKDKKLPTHKFTSRTTSVRVGALRDFMAGKVGG